MRKKYAVAVGHRSLAQGAYSPYLQKTEWAFNSPVAESLSDIADIYYRPNTRGIGEAGRINEMIDEINKKNYDLVVELHFDAFIDPRANGASALHFITNARTKKLAEKFTQMMDDRFGIRQRSNIAIKSTKVNGGTWIMNNDADAILLEPFFGSSQSDCDKMQNCEEEYADLIRDLLLNS